MCLRVLLGLKCVLTCPLHEDVRLTLMHDGPLLNELDDLVVNDAQG